MGCDMKHETVKDARTALINSGVLEFFCDSDIERVARWMYQEEKSPEQAAEVFGVDE